MNLLKKISYILLPVKTPPPQEVPSQNAIKPEQCLEKYETKCQDIQNSTEPIEGIFFIYKDKIVPDYFTECLKSDSVCMNCWRPYGDIRRQMYLQTFYHNYMINKFPELKYIWNEESLPRGRTVVYFTSKVLFLDKCYINNFEMIDKILNLYRLPKDTMIIEHYTCSNCNSNQNPT